MNRLRYPVVRVYPTHSVVVSEHVTRIEAENAAAYLDFLGEETGVYHVADDPCSEPDHRRAD